VNSTFAKVAFVVAFAERKQGDNLMLVCETEGEAVASVSGLAVEGR